MDTEILEDKKRNPYHSLIDHARINKLELFAAICCSLPGAGVEVGVYHGGSLVRIARFFRRTIFYGIDTFEGMPEVSERDLHKKGDFSDVDFDHLAEFLKTSLPNVKLIKGKFPDQKVLDEIEEKTFSFVHVDVDIYQSTMDCLEHFVPNLTVGGILVVDDYGFRSTPGAKEAVDQYTIKVDPHNYELKNMDTGQFMIRRTK